jgi:ribosomal protein S27AE
MNRSRLEKLEASVTGQGDGSEDLCPRCGGLQLETLMREAEALGAANPEGDDSPAGGDADLSDTLNARCRRCGAPTLLALLAAEENRWREEHRPEAG